MPPLSDPRSLLGTSIPDFQAIGTLKEQFRLSEFRGHQVILYFYPRDNTPGCTTETNEFNQYHEEFLKCNTQVFGISRDSQTSHQKFHCKLNLAFDLLSDSDEKICQLFKVINDKTLYGRLVRGIERSTFLLNTEGIVIREWRKVKVNNHVKTVLQVAQEQYQTT